MKKSNNLKKQAKSIVESLKAYYPLPECSLQHVDPYHLLVAVRLAAQCTDARVNIVTPALFERYPTPQDMAQADTEELCTLIRSTGFFNSKARDLILCAQQLCDRHGGEVPQDMDSLLALAGVGRKTANLIRGDVFGLPAIVTDTHCIRITNRLGLVNAKEPHKVEKQLWEIIEPQEGSDFCHRLVMFGREICTARKAHCDVCPVFELCERTNI